MSIAIDVPLILTLLVVVFGLVMLLDILFWAKQRPKDAKQPLLIDYSRAFFIPLLLVLIIRSFIIQPYRVPTGSLEPTILPGDFIAVNQFAYGLKLPVINTKIYAIGKPKIGDIALFRYPKNPKVIYVKRVIGTPGDHIVYDNKVLTINGKKASQTPVGIDLDNEAHISVPVQVAVENLLGVEHQIFVRSGIHLGQYIDIVVPPGNYFMMGDNRDDSDDSRVWGFVPEANFIGKVFAIWLSWDSENNNVRWNRVGQMIH
jgi:signal peptidase I